MFCLSICTIQGPRNNEETKEIPNWTDLWQCILLIIYLFLEFNGSVVRKFDQILNRYQKQSLTAMSSGNHFWNMKLFPRGTWRGCLSCQGDNKKEIWSSLNCGNRLVRIKIYRHYVHYSLHDGAIITPRSPTKGKSVNWVTGFFTIDSPTVTPHRTR